MSGTEGDGSSAASGNAAKSGFWGFIGSAAVIGALGTVFASVFQHISAYHDSVANLAKADLDKGVSTLADTVSALSTPLSLQQRLIWDYFLAHQENPKADDAITFHTSAHSIYDDYQKSFIPLSASTRLLARKMEIYLDLPGDLSHAANNSTAKASPINNSNLRTFEFDCDKEEHMPAFGIDGDHDRSQLPLQLKAKNGGQPATKTATTEGDSTEKLIVNWNSAKDNLVTLEYCFEDTHYSMKKVLQWASQSTGDKPESTKSIAADAEKLKIRAILQGQRFNDFMSVATLKIEKFRVGYQPNGLFCSLIGIDPFNHRCSPKELGDPSDAAAR
ncbi:MAG: hypothetical protein ACLPX7_22255 [Xanthobacteraceae bacterium]